MLLIEQVTNTTRKIISITPLPTSAQSWPKKMFGSKEGDGCAYATDKVIT